MEHVDCALCHIDKPKLLFESSDMLFEEKGTFNIVQCLDCGFVYLNPRPSRREMAHYYPDDQYYTCSPMPAQASLKSRIKRMIYESRPGYDMQLARTKKIAGKLLGWIFWHQMDVFVPYMPAGKLLDVGCGNGQLTAWLVNHGWHVYGVDLAPSACRLAGEAGLNISCGELEEASYPSDFFDVIVINHVLEHVHAPDELLCECHRILKSGGTLIVDVPNFGSFKAQLFRQSWSHIDSPRHLSHFTIETLESIIKSGGFTIEGRKLKLPLPLLDKRSLEFFKRSVKKPREAARVYWKTYVAQPLAWLFRDRANGSENITIYAVKR